LREGGGADRIVTRGGADRMVTDGEGGVALKVGGALLTDCTRRDVFKPGGGRTQVK
jgi:hypothetical protein